MIWHLLTLCTYQFKSSITVALFKQSRNVSTARFSRYIYFLWVLYGIRFSILFLWMFTSLWNCQEGLKLPCLCCFKKILFYHSYVFCGLTVLYFLWVVAYLSVSPSVYLSVSLYISIDLSFDPSVCLPTYMSIYLSINPSVY